MRVDSHQHFWKYDVQRHAWITDEMQRLKRDYLPPDLVPELRANGMEGCIAVQADQSEQETEFLLDLANRYDLIKGVVGWVDLLSPGVSQRLRYYSQFKKLRGFRHVLQAETDDGFMLRSEFCRGILPGRHKCGRWPTSPMFTARSREWSRKAIGITGALKTLDLTWMSCLRVSARSG